MADGKHCPKCQKDIGYLAIIRAPLPNLMKCPHCHCRIYYRDITMYVISLLLLFAIVVAAAFWAALSLLATLVILFVLWVVLELFTAWFLREHKELYTANGQTRQESAIR